MKKKMAMRTIKAVVMQRKRLNHRVIYQLFVALLAMSSLCGGQFQRFREQPKSSVVRIGQQLVLRCSIENVKGPVQWLRNGFGLGPGPDFEGYPRYRIIHEDTDDYHLNINNIQMEDDAQFECQVGATDESRGLKSERAIITVLVPPDLVSIDGAPHISVTSGESVNLTCRATNAKPPPTITWERSGHRVIDNISNETVGKEDGKRTDAISRLTILPTKTDQGNQFICRATSEAMEDEMTSSATLEVQYKAEILMTVSPEVQRVREWDSLSFECRAKANPANVSWRWFIGVHLIPDRSSGRFDLRNVNRTIHEQKVICEASNSVGISRKEFLLNIEYGPRFLSIAENPSADPGDAVELSCDVDSNPEATVIWHRMGSSNTLSRESILRIPSVTEEDFTTFTCTISVDGYKDISRQFHIRRKGPPRITSEQSQSAEYGATGTLECFVEGIPKPDKITWKKNGKDLHFNDRGPRYRIRNEDDANGRRSIIEITEVTDEDFAEYFCSAENSYGQDQLLIKYSRKESLSLAYILGGGVGGVVVVVIICVITVVIWRRHKSKDSDSSSSRSSEDSNSMKKSNNVPNIKVEYSTESTVDGWKESLSDDDQFPRYSTEYAELRYPTKDSTYSGLKSEFSDQFNEYEIQTRNPYFHPSHFDNVYGTYPRGMAVTYEPRKDSMYGPLYGGSETYATYGRPMRRDFGIAGFAPVLPQPPPPASPTDSKLSTNV